MHISSMKHGVNYKNVVLTKQDRQESLRPSVEVYLLWSVQSGALDVGKIVCLRLVHLRRLIFSIAVVVHALEHEHQFTGFLCSETVAQVVVNQSKCRKDSFDCG